MQKVQNNALFDMIGTRQKLCVARKTKHGIYLASPKDSNPSECVLLPNAYLRGDECIGDEIEVFIHTDSNDRIVATTQIPKATINSIALLPIKDSNEFGLFLDMGLAKDIFMPTKSTANYKQHTHVVVRITRDKMNRLIAKKDISPEIKPCKTKNLLHKKVSLWTISSSNLGVLCVVIPHYHYGMIYHNTLQKPLALFTQYEAKVAKVRNDGRLDLVLVRDRDKLYSVIASLNANGEYFCVNDSNTRELTMSKKGVKKELSQLLEQKRIIFVKDLGYCISESSLAKSSFKTRQNNSAKAKPNSVKTTAQSPTPDNLSPK